MRNPRIKFRLILVIQAVLGLLAGWQTLAGRAHLPAPLREYALSQPPAAGAPLWLGLLFAVLAIVTTVGAFLFWHLARPLWVGSFVLAFVAAPLFPPAVQTSIASTLQSAATALAGFLIALMYFAPEVAAEFTSRGAAVASDTSSVGENHPPAA